ncbi:hypothetical protein [Thalassoroseus pseudoceratinae]|uniref:hypothetical protein n=1 Tax=Thalassoroseus pseudoceratinae TaxID=2713176 RepID=UPI001422A5E5|nr:hypothetical protein [Thalassoroseus pseudoceratinae]
MQRVTRWISRIGVGVLFLVAAGIVTAEEVQLINGDRITGSVVSLSEKSLTLKSDLLGKIIIPRDKVGAIYLGDVKPPAQTNPAPQPESPTSMSTVKTPEDIIDQLTGRAVPGQKGASPDDVIQQLQRGGTIAPKDLQDIQQAFPLLAAPEAQSYFNDMVGGLMTGRKNLGDLRKDAITSRDALEDLKKDLGPDGAALNGYLSILNRFINETEPPQNKSSSKPPATDEQPKSPARFPAVEPPSTDN